MATVRFGDFEWDEAKATANLRKHGVDFTEACDVFDDPLAIDRADPPHADRLVILGHTRRARILFVVYAEVHGPRVRIISARRATRHERTAYEKEKA